MKRSTVLTLLIAFIVAMPAAVFSNETEFKNASEWCTANDDLGLKNHGACVSFMRACEGPGNSGALCACKELLYFNPSGFYQEYNNLGDCVNHLENGYISE